MSERLLPFVARPKPSVGPTDPQLRNHLPPFLSGSASSSFCSLFCPIYLSRFSFDLETTPYSDNLFIFSRPITQVSFYSSGYPRPCNNLHRGVVWHNFQGQQMDERNENSCDILHRCDIADFFVLPLWSDPTAWRRHIRFHEEELEMNQCRGRESKPAFERPPQSALVHTRRYPNPNTSRGSRDFRLCSIIPCMSVPLCLANGPFAMVLGFWLSDFHFHLYLFDRCFEVTSAMDWIVHGSKVKRDREVCKVHEQW